MSCEKRWNHDKEKHDSEGKDHEEIGIKTCKGIDGKKGQCVSGHRPTE